MGKTLKLNPSHKVTIEKLLSLQNRYDEAVASGDIVLARLLNIDMERLWHLLDVDCCKVCFHGRASGNECKLINRCQSFLQIKALTELEEGIELELQVNFQVF